MSFHDDLILNWAFSDTVTQRSNIDLWLAELEQWRARAEAAEANARQWEQTAREYSRVQEHTKTRAEAAEAALAAVGEYATYYACAREAFEADSDGPEPLVFAEWLAAGKPEVQP